MFSLQRQQLFNFEGKMKHFVTTAFNKSENYNLVHPDGHEPGIPEYKEKISENVDTKRARLLYQSRKRGMLENGLILSTFAQKHLKKFDEEQLRLYDRLINLPSNDWDIYNWATGSKETPAEFDNAVMDLLKKHVKNEKKQAMMQPDL